LITNLLHINFQEEPLNSRRLPVFPEGISNSSRFPVFPEVANTLTKLKGVTVNTAKLFQISEILS